MNKENAIAIWQELLEKSEQRVSKTNDMVEKFAEAATTIGGAAVQINQMAQTLNTVSNDNIAKLQEDVRNLILNCEKKDEDIRVKDALLTRYADALFEKDRVIAELRKRIMSGEKRIDKLLSVVASQKKEKMIEINNK